MSASRGDTRRGLILNWYMYENQTETRAKTAPKFFKNFFQLMKNKKERWYNQGVV